VLAELIATALRPAPGVERLRCRVFTSSPARAISRPDPGPRRLAHLPMLVPRDRVRALSGPPPHTLEPHVLRWALAAALALVGSRIPISDVADEIGTELDGWALPEALHQATAAGLADTSLSQRVDISLSQVADTSLGPPTRGWTTGGAARSISAARYPRAPSPLWSRCSGTTR